MTGSQSYYWCVPHHRHIAPYISVISIIRKFIEQKNSSSSESKRENTYQWKNYNHNPLYFRKEIESLSLGEQSWRNGS